MSDSSNRSVSISGNATGSVIQTGDNNAASVVFQQASLPQPENVNMTTVLEAMGEILSQLESLDSRKITNAIDDAKEELKKPDPSKNEVGQAVDRALSYAQKAKGFTEAIEKLRPYVEKAAGWLGEHWYKLLPMVGLTL